MARGGPTGKGTWGYREQGPFVKEGAPGALFLGSWWGWGHSSQQGLYQPCLPCLGVLMVQPAGLGPPTQGRQLVRRRKVPLSLRTALTPAQAQWLTLEALPNTQDLRCILVKKYLRVLCKDDWMLAEHQRSQMKGITCPEVSYVPRSRVQWVPPTSFNQGPKLPWEVYLVRSSWAQFLGTPKHEHILQI